MPPLPGRRRLVPGSEVIVRAWFGRVTPCYRRHGVSSCPPPRSVPLTIAMARAAGRGLKRPVVNGDMACSSFGQSFNYTGSAPIKAARRVFTPLIGALSLSLSHSLSLSLSLCIFPFSISLTSLAYRANRKGERTGAVVRRE